MTHAVILNVDDNEINRYLRTQYLRAANFEVVEARTAAETLAAISRNRPELALLDVNLPDMDGVELCRRIKTDPRSKSIMVLQISASAIEIVDAVRGLEGGADGYLVEPIEPELLIAHVRSMLRLRNSEAALKRSEQRLRMALDAARMGTWEWDISRNSITWDAANYAVLGVPPGAFGGTYEDFLALMHPEDRDRVKKHVQEALEAQTGNVVEFRIVRPEGRVRWIEAQALLIRDNDGRPERMTGTSCDITDRKRAEERLRESEERLVLSHRGAGIGMWDWNFKTGQRFVNEQYFLVHGRPPASDAVGYEEWLSWVYPADREAADANFKQLIEGAGVYDDELRVVWPDGTVHWLASKGEALRDADGAIYRAIGVLYDITRRKEAETALRQANEDLQQFAFAAGHDLQGPLRTTRVFTQLLDVALREKIGPELRAHLDRIIDASNRMEALIASLLSYARAGQLPSESPENMPWMKPFTTRCKVWRARSAKAARRSLPSGCRWYPPGRIR